MSLKPVKLKTKPDAQPGIHIRVTDEELDMIRADAKAQGRTVSGYVRYRLLHHHPV